MGRIIFKTTSGNVIGVVERPTRIDPWRPLQEQYVVKIGVMDRDRGLPEEDARIVIDNLYKLVINL
jgi:hypothetical protein